MNTERIEVGFTQFMDFCLKRDVSRVSYIRSIKYQAKYSPATDFWKELRDEIKRIHKTGANVSELDHLLSEISDRKLNQYSIAIQQYKKFCHGKEILWFDVNPSFWSYDRLFVRSTPEMGLIINGTPYLVKMYFKEHKEKLDQRRVDSLLSLMQDSVSMTEYPNTKHAILNIKKAKLYPLNKNVTDTMRLALEANAENFIYLWDKV